MKKKQVTINRYIADVDVTRLLHRFNIRSKTRTFRKTKNPVYALEAFLLAQQEKIEIPKSILEWLTSCFRKWHDGQAKESLDRIMGLKVGKGRTPPYKAALIDDRNEMLYEKMAVLKSLGLRLEDAAEMVSRGHEEARDWNISKWTLPTISAESLFSGYVRWSGRHTVQEYLSEELPKWSRECVREFLSIFPSDSVSGLARETLRRRL